MDDGGFQSLSDRCRQIWGRRGHTSGGHQRRQYSFERALSASTLLPTAAFAALSAMTVLAVAQMGMSPLGALVGPGAPSARDGGLAVTSPRMSISIAPPFERPLALQRDRATTRARISPVAFVPVAFVPAAFVPVAFIAAPDAGAGANPVASVVFVAQPRSVDTGATEPFQYSTESQSADDSRHGKSAHHLKSAKSAKFAKFANPKPAPAVKHLKDANDAKVAKAPDRVKESKESKESKEYRAT